MVNMVNVCNECLLFIVIFIEKLQVIRQLGTTFLMVKLWLVIPFLTPRVHNKTWVLFLQKLFTWQNI